MQMSAEFYDIWLILRHVGDMLTTFPTKIQLIIHLGYIEQCFPDAFQFTFWMAKVHFRPLIEFSMCSTCQICQMSKDFLHKPTLAPGSCCAHWQPKFQLKYKLILYWIIPLLCQYIIHVLILDNIQVHLYTCPKNSAILLIFSSLWHIKMKLIFALHLTIV